MKIFLDANVLFSAANKNSNLHVLLNELLFRFNLITSDYAVGEASRNLSLKRPVWMDEFSKLMAGITIVPSVDQPLDVPIAAKDRPIISTALKHKCIFLVTGDKRDFGHLYGKKLGSMAIVSPLMMSRICANLTGST